MKLQDLLAMFEPFMDGAAKMLVENGGPVAHDFGEKVGQTISKAFHKTKTEADDTLVTGVVAEFTAGLNAGLTAPATQPGAETSTDTQQG